MKKEYVRPSMVCETFAADEYVAACGDSGKVYKFVCDAPRGDLYYYPQSDGQIDGIYEGEGRKRKLGYYRPCDVTHEAPSTSAFYDGFVDYNENRQFDSGEGVIVWTGIWGMNGHATKNLNMEEWETAKS